MDKKVLDLYPELIRTDTEYQEVCDVLAEEFDLVSNMVNARKRAGLTQQDVAQRMGISQSAVAKIESGWNLNVKTLRRYAAATGTKLRLSFEAQE